ncbi:Ycf66 family protein [Leptolyngbya sp. FACHB-8]|uniref:Ycf66 family protein n=1 Tax=unclassified Leptolyngbya TaxID=2650499 RepID=UPI00168229A4|nr:Ycf66 family protein [Leptolyngbya sp. FACHB-8]MBD1911405.1 hypothetical protein [Leptolyngbya sp. FACHB-8]
MAHLLAILVGLSGFILYMAAFFFPEVHRKNDFIWSGVIFFYALALWVYSGRITGGVLLGQVASVVVLGWLGWQTLAMRRQLTPYDQQTWVSSSGKSVGDVLFLNATQLGSQFKQRWEQLPLPAPLKGLPDQVGRTVGNLQAKPQPKMAPQAPVKTAEGAEAEPRKVRKKPKTTQETPASQSATSPDAALSKTEAPQTEVAPETKVAIASTPPLNEPTATPESNNENASSTKSASAIEASDLERAIASPQPTSESAQNPEPPVETAQAYTSAAPVSEPPAERLAPAPERDFTPESVSVVDTPSSELTPAPSDASTPQTGSEPETAADIPFTPPPGTEPTAVAHVVEVTPAPPKESFDATTPMEIAPPSPSPTVADEPSYIVNTETMVPALELPTGPQDISDIPPESPIPTSIEPVETATNQADETSELAETISGTSDSIAFPTESTSGDLSGIEQESEALMAPPATSPTDEPETEWEAMTQDLWGGAVPAGETASVEDEREDDVLEDSPTDRQSVVDDGALPSPVPIATAKGLDLSMPNVSESLQEEDWGEEDTEESVSNGSAEDWDMDWNEPPDLPTPIQPPPVQPIIEPEELTFADMVAAANRTLTPEDRVVVDVKAIAITDDDVTPPVDNWDDWDEEDNDAWFDR